jgi:hypothetical protein
VTEPTPAIEHERVAYAARYVKVKKYRGGWDIEVRIGPRGQRADATAVFKDLGTVEGLISDLNDVLESAYREQRRRADPNRRPEGVGSPIRSDQDSGVGMNERP